MRYGDAFGWDLPVFIEKELFADEFFGHDERIMSMYQNLDSKVQKAMATEAADMAGITFEYWRKINEKATKMKPLSLRAELFMNPDYGIVWALVSRD